MAIGLANTTVMGLTVAYSTAKKQMAKMTDEATKELKRLCSELVELGEYRMELLNFLEATMSQFAPNLCEIIGPKVASKLVSAAGGLQELARTPACNI